MYGDARSGESGQQHCHQLSAGQFQDRQADEIGILQPDTCQSLVVYTVLYEYFTI